MSDQKDKQCGGQQLGFQLPLTQGGTKPQSSDQISENKLKQINIDDLPENIQLGLKSDVPPRISAHGVPSQLGNPRTF